jgi:hypothetical protein
MKNKILILSQTLICQAPSFQSIDFHQTFCLSLASYFETLLLLFVEGDIRSFKCFMCSFSLSIFSRKSISLATGQSPSFPPSRFFCSRHQSHLYLFVRWYEHVTSAISLGQHGFLCNRSCTTQLLQVLHKIRENLDSNIQTYIIVYLDFTKAIDCVEHVV